MPKALDQGLLCTNLRSMDGKRPVFVDRHRLDLLLPVPPHPVHRDPCRRRTPSPGRSRRRGARAKPRRRGRAGRGPGARRGLPAPHPRGLTDRRSLAPASPARDSRASTVQVRVSGRAEPGATLPAVPKNLVIVESPAKARTIERYLGDDYRVLASYGHVRDLPENPGKGKFGVDVDHDFAPEYVVSDDRKKQVAEIAKAAQVGRHRLPRDRPRPRGRGDRLARRRGRATSPRRRRSG